jgi:hypothetical protein
MGNPESHTPSDVATLVPAFRELTRREAFAQLSTAHQIDQRVERPDLAVFSEACHR